MWCHKTTGKVYFVISVVALAVTLASTVHASGNLIENSGFEKGVKGWSQGANGRFASQLAVEKTDAHEGSHALKITSDSGKDRPFIYTRVDGLAGGSTYTYRAYARGNPGDQVTNGSLKIEYYDAEGNLLKQSHGSFSPVPHEWRLFENTLTAPVGTVRATVLLRLYTFGPLWFDAVEFVESEAAPPIVLYPHRIVIDPAKESTVDVIVRPGGGVESISPRDVHFELYPKAGGNAASIDAKPVGKLGSEINFRLDIPALDAGEFEVRARYRKHRKLATSGLFVRVADRKPTSIDDEGFQVIDGKRFFPIGMYGVSLKDTKMFADKGFNASQGWHGHDMDRLADRVEEAAASGVRMGINCYAEHKYVENVPLTRRKINAFAGKEGILNFRIADEPDLRDGHLAQAAQAYRELKQTNPDSVLVMTVATPRDYEFAANFCDVLHIDPYWYPSAKVTHVVDYLKQATASVKDWQPVYVVLPAGWSAKPMNQPPYEECRAAVYLSIIHGAKGVYWFTAHMREWRIENTPMWRRFGQLNAETARLGHLVTTEEGEARLAVNADESVHWRAIRSGGVDHLIMVNASEDAQSIKISGTQRADTLWDELNATRLGSPTIELAPLEVRLISDTRPNQDGDQPNPSPEKP